MARTNRGAQQRGPCPWHGSTSGTSRCFSANLERNLFHCFKCGSSGNALDLWARARNLTPYDAALDLCQRGSAKDFGCGAQLRNGDASDFFDTLRRITGDDAGQPLEAYRVPGMKVSST